jgi:hypothetical protein
MTDQEQQQAARFWAEFNEVHSKEGPPITLDSYGRRTLYPDGAMVCNGATYPPPPEQMERFRNRKWYLQEILDRIQRDYDSLTQRTSRGFEWPKEGDWRASIYGPCPMRKVPPPGSGEELDVQAAEQRLREVYAEYKKRLEDLRA